MSTELAGKDESVPGPSEMEKIVEFCIRHYQQNRRDSRFAAIVAEQLQLMLSHPDICDEIHYWKHCQYYRMEKQWRWIASRALLEEK